MNDTEPHIVWHDEPESEDIGDHGVNTADEVDVAEDEETDNE